MTSTRIEQERLMTRWPSFGTWYIGLVLIVIGTAISAYLSYTHLFAVNIVCIENSAFDCMAVQNSRWSEMFGIPVAYSGLASYLLIGALWVLMPRSSFLQANGLLILFALTFVAWVFSMWLVYVQFAIIDALCQWCLAHEVTITLLLGVVIYRLWKE